MKLAGYRPKDMAADNTIAEGTYRVRCNKFDVREPKNTDRKDTVDGPRFYDKETGKEKYSYCLADLVITEEGTHFGRHVFDNFITTEPGQDWKLRQYTIAAELPEDKEFDTDDMLNTEFYIVVTNSKAGKGKDGNWYEAQSRPSKIMSLETAKQQLGV